MFPCSISVLPNTALPQSTSGAPALTFPAALLWSGLVSTQLVMTVLWNGGHCGRLSVVDMGGGQEEGCATRQIWGSSGGTQLAFHLTGNNPHGLVTVDRSIKACAQGVPDRPVGISFGGGDSRGLVGHSARQAGCPLPPGCLWATG